MATGTATSIPQETWDKQIASMPDSTMTWLFPGFLAPGNMTLLTSMWKAGKTTLLAHLLARRVTGQSFLDRPVTMGKTVVISEEPRTLWADRCRKFDFGGKLCLFAEPFANLPSLEQWRGLLGRVGELHDEHGIDLLVIDSVTHFLRAENAVSGVLDLLMPVRALTARGMSALLMHHPRRHGASEGNAGRGHGALFSEVDISIEMRHYGNSLDSRARRLFCLSRHAETPRHFLFELNADGSDYFVLSQAAEADADCNEHLAVLRMVLEDAPQKLTRDDILDEWPADFPKPAVSTLRSWLLSAVANGSVFVEGTGRKRDPYRHWIAAAEARWREAPLYAHLEKQRRDLNLPFRSLREQRHEEE